MNSVYLCKKRILVDTCLPVKVKRPSRNRCSISHDHGIEPNSAKIKEQENRIKQLSNDLEQKEKAQKELIERLAEQNKQRVQRGNRLRERIFSVELREKEEKLKNEFDERIQLLHGLNSSLEKAIKDKENERENLVAQLQAKEGALEKYKESQKQLESCLEELRKEIEERDKELDKQKQYTKKVEDNARQNVICLASMEDEFTCIICHELFIDATTLPCAHSFCAHCLRLWLRKKETCPVCQRKLKVQASGSIVLDSSIEKMIEFMDEDTRLRRVKLKRERDELKGRADSCAPK